VNRKIRGPAGALQTTGAAWVGKSATNLVKAGLGVLSAKSRIGRLGRSRERQRKERGKDDSERKPARHANSPQPISSLQE
jgi:hypothetical protein